MSLPPHLPRLQAAFPGKLFLTYSELAKATTLTVGSLRTMICRKQIPLSSVKLGKRAMFRIEDVAKCLDDIIKEPS